MPDIFGFFQKRRIALTQKEIKETEKLCRLQMAYNELLKEEKRIQTA